MSSLSPTGHMIRNLTALSTGHASYMCVWDLSIYERSLAVCKGRGKSMYKYELIWWLNRVQCECYLLSVTQSILNTATTTTSTVDILSLSSGSLRASGFGSTGFNCLGPNGVLAYRRRESATPMHRETTAYITLPVALSSSSPVMASVMWLCTHLYLL